MRPRSELLEAERRLDDLLERDPRPSVDAVREVLGNPTPAEVRWFKHRSLTRAEATTTELNRLLEGRRSEREGEPR